MSSDLAKILQNTGKENDEHIEKRRSGKTILKSGKELTLPVQLRQLKKKIIIKNKVERDGC